MMDEKIFKVLSVLYQLRVLTVTQIHQLALYNAENKNGGVEYSKKLIKKMVQDGLVKYNRISTRHLYTITAKGVTELRKNTVTRIGNTTETIEATKTPNQISLSEKNIPHQMAQNQFVVALSAILKKTNLNWWYSDDAFINKDFLGVFRPDGVLYIHNRCYFIEMDMGTEQAKALQTKWQNYRKLFANGYINDKYGTVQVLFLIDGVVNIEKRKEVVEKTIQEIIPDITNNQVMDILIDTPENMLQFMQEEITEQILKTSFPQWKIDLSQKGYKFYSGNQLPTENCKFQTLCHQKDEKGIVVYDNIVEEYVVDDGRYSRQSVIYNARNYRYNMMSLKAVKGRTIKYVIIVEDGKTSKELEDAVWQEDGILLTTQTRLSSQEGSKRFFKKLKNEIYTFDKTYKILNKEGD